MTFVYLQFVDSRSVGSVGGDGALERLSRVRKAVRSSVFAEQLRRHFGVRCIRIDLQQKSKAKGQRKKRSSTVGI